MSEKTMTELLPCPFCDAPPHYAFEDDTWHYVRCTKCSSQAGIFPTKPMAFRAWNTRAPVRDPAQSAPAPHDNNTIRTAAKALDYLADHTRPIGGQETYNAEHLIQIAYELREIANAAPPAPASEPVALREVAAGRVATDLLLQWVDGADENHPAYRETMAFLGLPNSQGWVWAAEVRFERDFDAELERTRKLALEAVEQAEANATPPQAQPVAWRYELAHARFFDKDDKPGAYTDWRWHINETEPHVPEGSIRNLTPLYARSGQNRDAKVRWARPVGSTFGAMRDNVWKSGLADIGDTILVWINEGDFWQIAFSGLPMQEFTCPPSPHIPGATREGSK